jgi:hypothetical protein
VTRYRRRRIVTLTVVAVGALGLVLSASGVAAARSAHSAAIRLARKLEPAQGKQRVGKHQLFTTNWSGYGATGDTFSDVTGTWTQPAATCSYKGKGQQSNAAIFAGLDGINSGTVEQTGVDTICVGTQAEYIPWYEFYPARTVTIPCQVHAGDTLTSGVSKSGLTVTTTLTDASRACNGGSGTWMRQGFLSSAGLALNSAEWIVERNIQRMTNFDSVTWTSANATGSTHGAGSISNFTNTSIIAVNHNGPNYTVCASPGDLMSSGTSFTDTWNDCS